MPPRGSPTLEHTRTWLYLPLSLLNASTSLAASLLTDSVMIPFDLFDSLVQVCTNESI